MPQTVELAHVTSVNWRDHDQIVLRKRGAGYSLEVYRAPDLALGEEAKRQLEIWVSEDLDSPAVHQLVKRLCGVEAQDLGWRI